MGLPSVSAIVLAAGVSERMGAQNKLLLDYGGKPLVTHVVDTILGAGLDEVVVVLGHESERVRHALADHPVAFAVNDRFTEGMTTSIHAGLLAAREDAIGYMICLADLPLIESWELEVLIEAFHAANHSDERHIVVPFYQGQRGNPVVFPAHYKPEILAEQGLTGCRGLVKQHRDLVVEVKMETDHVLTDVDTPQEWSAVSPHHDPRSTYE